MALGPIIKTDGTIVNPITDRWGTPLNYSGQNLEPYADLSNEYLVNAGLPDANLENTNFSATNLSSAHLSYANISNSNLTNTNLYSADMYFTNFSNSILQNANLSYSDMYYSNLKNANLLNADLSGALLIGVNFSGAIFNSDTIFPDGFNPAAAGMTFVPLPAGIYLFLSGLVGLVGVKLRGRNA